MSCCCSCHAPPFTSYPGFLIWTQVLTPSRALSLQPHGCLVAQHGGSLVQHPHPQIGAPRVLRHGARPHPSYRTLPRQLECTPRALCLDQRARGHHPQSSPTGSLTRLPEAFDSTRPEARAFARARSVAIEGPPRGVGRLPDQLCPLPPPAPAEKIESADTKQ